MMPGTTDFAEIMTMITRAANEASTSLQTAYAATEPRGETGSRASDSSVPVCHEWSDLIDDLLAIRGLEDDWDGQGAQAPSSALVDGAIRFAQEFQRKGIEPADRVLASVNGTVYFEWHRPGGYVEIEVTAPDTAEARCVGTGSDKTEVISFSCRR